MQISLLFLRLMEDWRSPLAPAKVLQRVQEATAASTAFGWPSLREPAPLFQGWVKVNEFRISLFPKSHNRRHQSSVVIEGKVVADDAGGSRLRLLYRPLLVQLLMLGFWLVFGGTLVLVSLLEWLRGPQPSFSWGPTGIVCAFYGLAVLSFWWDARKNRQRLISLLGLKQPNASAIF